MDLAEQTALADNITKQIAADLDARTGYIPNYSPPPNLNEESLRQLVTLPPEVLIPAVKQNITIVRIIKHNLDTHPILMPMFDTCIAFAKGTPNNGK
jgi:hypothetical protein